MTFSITCNECGFTVKELKDFEGGHPDGESLSDSKKTITISAVPDFHGMSHLEIKCKCGNEA